MNMRHTDDSHVLAALTDSELIRLSLDGSERAFAELMERYTPAVLGYLIGRVPRGTEAEDLAQEVFITAYRSLEKLRNRERFGPWIIKITKNRLYDTARERRRVETEFAQVTGDEGGQEVLERVAGTTSDPSAHAEEQELAGVLEDALGALSDKYRSVLYLRLVEQLESNVIAERLGISHSAARVRIHRGMKALSKELGKLGLTEDGL